MKKFLSILLIIVYSAATFGMSVKQLYCCGKLTSVSISLNIVDKEKGEKQTKDDGCCKTKYHSYKVKDNHIVADAVAFRAMHFIHAYIYSTALTSYGFTNPALDTPNGIHDPPLLHGNIPIYIFNCVFLI